MKCALIMLILVTKSASACFSQQLNGLDRSFYHAVDRSDWPGDALSEKQTEAAYQHFSDPNACDKPWRWALIGPNTFLLKGTKYTVIRYANYINVAHGFWGGDTYDADISTLVGVMRHVESRASDDCRYGYKP